MRRCRVSKYWMSRSSRAFPRARRNQQTPDERVVRLTSSVRARLIQRMRRNTLETVSVWQETSPAPPAGQRAREQTGVCVIGAGIAGLTAAYLLRRAGHDVQVVEAYEVGAGETGRTTAHLTAVLDDRFVRLEKLFGEERARRAA